MHQKGRELLEAVISAEIQQQNPEQIEALVQASIQLQNEMELDANNAVVMRGLSAAMLSGVQKAYTALVKAAHSICYPDLVQEIGYENSLSELMSDFPEQVDFITQNAFAEHVYASDRANIPDTGYKNTRTFFECKLLEVMDPANPQAGRDL